MPLIQKYVGIKKINPLKGAIEEKASPQFSWKKWFSGEYAKSAEEYVNHGFGFKPIFVRSDNQLAYSLFGEVRANNVLVGKEEYLFEKNYIEAYTGKDFIGIESIEQNVRMFKNIQDSLWARGKHVLVVLAPGKASFYPEFIPDEYGTGSDSTNYLMYVQELGKQGVDYLDFNAWFMQNKGKKEYPLYPKTGIHWSHYGMLLAADSIIRRIEKVGEWDLPEIKWTNIEYVDEIRRIDDDIEQAMNLLFPFENRKMAYPNISIVNGGKDRPKVVCIADSFFWEMFNMGISDKVFGKGEFWYYFNTVYPQEYTRPTKMGDINLSTAIDSSDVFVFMATEGNLAHFPWGGHSALNQVFSKEYSYDEKKVEENKIQLKIQEIKNDQNWLRHVEGKAKKNGISLDSMLYLDAVYMLNQ